MRNKDSIIRKLSIRYDPETFGSDSLYEKVFQPLVERKETEFFFEFFEKGELESTAWGFLGLYGVLKEKKLEDLAYNFPLVRFHEAVIKILNDKREISYSTVKEKVRTTLREHHVRRISWLDISLTFKPVFEYCKSFKDGIDNVIAELIEKVLTKESEKEVEPLVINFAKSVPTKKLDFKIQIIKGLENLGGVIELKELNTIKDIFKQYLDDMGEGSSDAEGIRLEKKVKESIFKVAAVLNLDLEEETMNYVDTLDKPYSGLYEIAKKYKDNERFKSILLKILSSTNNPYLITDVLRAILVIQEGIQNWKEIIIDHVNKYELNDENLILEMESSNLIQENMIVQFLNQGAEWQIIFIRDFFTNHPEKFDEWSDFQANFIKNLEDFEASEANFKDKKALGIKLIIDLEKKDLIRYCIDSVKNLDDDQLRKTALFAIITYGNDVVWKELRKCMDADEELGAYVKKFWAYLKRNEWKYYY